MTFIVACQNEKAAFLMADSALSTTEEWPHHDTSPLTTVLEPQLLDPARQCRIGAACIKIIVTVHGNAIDLGGFAL